MLKSDPATNSVPIFQVSAEYCDSEHKANALDLAAYGYLVHPFAPVERTATIRTLVRAKRAKDEAHEQHLKAHAELALRQRAEEELRESNRQLREMFDNALAMTIWNDEGYVMDVNSAAGVLFGRSRGERCALGNVPLQRRPVMSPGLFEHGTQRAVDNTSSTWMNRSNRCCELYNPRFKAAIFDGRSTGWEKHAPTR